MEKSKVLIQFLVFFRQFGDVLFFLNVRRLRGYTATDSNEYVSEKSTTDEIDSNSESFRRLVLTKD